VNYLQNVLQLICNGMLAESCYIDRISVESHDTTGRTNESRGPKSKGSTVGANVKYHPTRLNGR
jgi:hypothetical protein